MPRVGATVDLTERFALKALYGEAFRAPYQAEKKVDIKTIIVGNEDLDPETIRTVDLSLLFIDESLQASFTWFWSKQEGLITRVSTATGPPKFDNLDFRRSRGAICLSPRARGCSSVPVHGDRVPANVR